MSFFATYLNNVNKQVLLLNSVDYLPTTFGTQACAWEIVGMGHVHYCVVPAMMAIVRGILMV